MKSKPPEFSVYLRLTELLERRGWEVVCACPPGGTNTRYRKCVLPRRAIGGSEKGPRDEVDVIAHNGTVILLAECKPSLSESLIVLSGLLESDYDKLKRLASSFSPGELARLLKRATGCQVPANPVIALVLAVGLIDVDEELDVTVVELGETSVKVVAVEPLASLCPGFE